MNNHLMKTLIICTLSLILLSFTACRHHGDGRHTDINRVTGHIVKELALDSDQENQLSGILASFEEKRKELDKPHALRTIFVEQLKNEELDEEYLRKETSEYMQELENTANELITELALFHSSLSVDQREKLANFINKEKGKKYRHSRR